MNSRPPLWISEAEVAALIDLRGAIDALETGLRLEAEGHAANMSKTHVTWGKGDTLHAVGAVFESAGVIGTKTWAHTEGGATPLLLMWSSHSGALLAVIEAFALGQMRTGAMSGVATRWMASETADCLALFGTGKQALAQLASVAAVRALAVVRVWGRDKAKRDTFLEAVRGLGYGFSIEAPDSVEQAADGASILTLATRAREPFLTASMVAQAAHINAIGAITPEREEFAQDIMGRTTLVAVDDPQGARRLSRELGRFYGEKDERWAAVRPVCEVVGGDEARRKDRDLSLFKAMGMGISDLALGTEIYRRALAANCGRAFEHPRRAPVRLGNIQGTSHE